MKVNSTMEGVQLSCEDRSPPGHPRSPAALRRGLGALGCLAVFLRGLPVFFRLQFSGQTNWRALWAQWISREFLKIINCRVHVHGDIPQDGLIVCNHLGYLDILVILSAFPATFVSKSEVRRWPFFGLLVTMAGTIFVDRERKTTIRASIDSIARSLLAGVPVVVFPEGTSSDGRDVLPFRSPLLKAAIVAGASITPAAISYHLEEGSVVEEMCYWRDMNFATHFWNLLGKRSLSATVRFGSPHPSTAGRKELAHTLRLATVELRNG